MNRARLLEQVADVALKGDSAEDVMERARLLKQFYGESSQRIFVERVKKINADEVGWLVSEVGTTLKQEVIQLLAQYPQQREQILADFKSVFPYDFLDTLQAAHRKIRADG